MTRFLSQLLAHLRHTARILGMSTIIVIANFAFTTGAHAQVEIIRVHGDTGFAIQAPALPPGAIGDSWTYPYKYLQDALADAAMRLNQIPEPEAVQIWVAATDSGNPYRPHMCSEYHAALQAGINPCEWSSSGGGLETCERWSFHLQNNVEIYGGFEGGETALEQRKPAENITVLSGDIDGDDDSGQASSLHGFAVGVTPLTAGAHIDQTAIISGFTVRSTHRPAFVADGARLHVLNCVFSSSAPAAVHLRSNAEVVFYGCVFAAAGNAISASDEAMFHCVDD